MVYTYVGDIVVSVNPFKNTGCVGKEIRAKYKGGQRTHLPPHIYALVDQTCAHRRAALFFPYARARARHTKARGPLPRAGALCSRISKGRNNKSTPLCMEVFCIHSIDTSKRYIDTL